MPKSLPIRIENSTHELFVYWLITDWCNQHCSYCPSQLNQGLYHRGVVPGWPTLDSMLAFISKIQQHSKVTGRRLRVSLSGGEPTIHPHFAEILAALGESTHTEVITNGTRSSAWWDQLAVLPQRAVISLHPEYWHHRRENIIDLTDYLTGRGVNLVYNLLADPRQWPVVQQIVQELRPEYRPRVIVKPIQDMQQSQARPRVDYTADQLLWIKNYPTKITNIFTDQTWLVREDLSREPVNPAQLMADDQHRFRGWRCAAGVSSITVNWQGHVSAGICNSEFLGTLEDFALRETYIPCAKDQCTCPGDIVLDKYQARRSTEPAENVSVINWAR